MNALILTLCATTVGVAAHAIVLRVAFSRRHLMILPLLLLLALSAAVLLLPLPEHPLHWEDTFVALILTLSFGFSYALIVVGVVYDSPTLALVNSIESHGAAGMPLTEFDAFVRRHPFLRSRLDALIAAGELGIIDDSFQLTGKATHLLRIGDAYRRLRGDNGSSTG